MDNNNSLPYGAISSNIESLQLQQRQILPTEVEVASNSSSFNPLLVARNVHVDHPMQSSRNASHFSSRQHHSTQRNNPYRVSHSSYNSNTTFGENLRSTSSNLSDSNSSLIIHDNEIPFRDTQAIETSNQPLSNAGMTNVLRCNRYFHPQWTTPERTQDEAPRTTSHSIDSRSSTAHLPIIKEEGMPSAVTTRSSDPCRKHSILKRRVSKEDEYDGLPRPASKVLLTEEKMAAKLHNLRISNDHCYYTNGLSSSLVDAMNGIVSEPYAHPSKRNVDKRTDEHKEDDNNNMESSDGSMFVLAPGIKEVLEKGNEMLPQSIIDQMSKPCLAVIPWKPQNDVMARLSLNFNKTDDEKAEEKNSDYFKSKIMSDVNHHQANEFTNRSVHAEAMDDLLTETFDLDEDDMDL